MKLRTLFIGGAAAAAATYLFDPRSGAGRRARLRDQLMARMRDVRAEAERKERHVVNVAQGAAAEMRSRASEIGERATSTTSVIQDAGADDALLHDRVLSEALGRPDVPKDRIVVNVEDGIVVLRGELDTQRQIDDVLERVGAVRGVRAIDSLLHVHGTPAPNTRDAREASDRAERDVPSSGAAIE